jgi:hypothetical protein
VSQLLQNFPGKICKFPGKYLGLPLHIRQGYPVGKASCFPRREEKLWSRLCYLRYQSIT